MQRLACFNGLKYVSSFFTNIKTGEIKSHFEIFFPKLKALNNTKIHFAFTNV